MFCFGIPGTFVPPPTERIIPRSPPFSKTSSVASSRTSSRRAAHTDFERIHISHQAHPVTDAVFHFGDVRLLAPVQYVEADIREIIKARLDFRVVVIQLHPVFRERVAVYA